MRLSDALIAEFIGTLLLFLVGAGADIAATRLAGGGFEVVLADSLAVGFGISALILSLNPVSGAYFNPLVSVLMCCQKELEWKHLPAYLAVQFGGALIGVLLTHSLFALPLFQLSAHPQPGFTLAWSEWVATLGLLIVIHRVGETRSQAVAYAVGAYLVAATWFTPSHAVANPALTVARMFTDTGAGIRPLDALGFLLAQCLALAALVLAIRARKRFGALGD
ncbi:MAG TPA: aquaporin [Gammaproteobacteria bacterium]